MKILTIAVLLVASTLAHAQQRPSDEQINAQVQAVIEQREVNANQAAVLKAQLMIALKDLEKAKADAAKCTPKEDKK